IDQVLSHLVESLAATHGIVRLKEGEGNSVQLVARASVGFEQSFLTRYAKLSAMEPWAQQMMKGKCQFLQSDEEWEPVARRRVDEAGLKRPVTLPRPGKQASWNSSPCKMLPTRVALTARESAGKVTRPIRGCPAISWPPIPRLRIPVDCSSEPSTS